MAMSPRRAIRLLPICLTLPFGRLIRQVLRERGDERVMPARMPQAHRVFRQQSKFQLGIINHHLAILDEQRQRCPYWLSLCEPVLSAQRSTDILHQYDVLVARSTGAVLPSMMGSDKGNLMLTRPAALGLKCLPDQALDATLERLGAYFQQPIAGFTHGLYPYCLTACEYNSFLVARVGIPLPRPGAI